MKSRYKILIIAIPTVLIFLFFVISYDNALDDTPYDVEIIFDAEEYAVNYFVVNGNADNIEIEIPFDMIDGVFMVYVNDQVVDDERIILDGNKIIINYGQNIESVKLMGSHDLGGAEPESYSEINLNCMTLEQSKDIAPFFKVPSYLPEGYFMKCSRSSTPSESYIIYHNKDVSDGWIGRIHMLVEDGAIFIHQTDERTIVGEEKFATLGSAEQRIQETYDSVMDANPSLQPQLIRINGMLAYAVDSCPDCGVQTADFPDGTSIQKSTSTETRIKFKDEYGISYVLKTTLSLDELILVAESLQ